MPRRTSHLLPTPLFSPPGKSTGASPSLFLLATKAPASPKKSSAPPTSASTFRWPAALSPSTPLLPLRSSSTKPPASATPPCGSCRGAARCARASRKPHLKPSFFSTNRELPAPAAQLSPFTFPTKRFRLKESMSLFSKLPASPADSDVPAANQPLAERMRPRTLDEFIGQEKLLGPGKPLRTQIESDNIGSMLFWGPPDRKSTRLNS